MNLGDMYKPNSHAYKEEQKRKELEDRKIEKVAVSRPVTTKKKSGISKFSDVFVSEDAHTVGSQLLVDVFIPTAKTLISDLVTKGLNIILYGESGGRGDRKPGGSSYVSYRSYSDRDRRDESRRPYDQSMRFDYDDIVFDTRSDAIAVLDNMCDVIAKYGFVTVADLYDMVELTHPYTATKYGWTNLSSAKAVAYRSGYILKLPKAMVID